MPAVAAETGSEPQTATSDGLIRDQEGRVSYIVEVLPEAAAKYSDNFVPNARFQAHDKGHVVNLIQAMEWQYGFESESITSWGIVSFAAFLDADQLARLRGDQRVYRIEPDVVMHFSDSDTTAVWADSVQTLAAPPNSLWKDRVTQAVQMQPWGKRAVNQTTVNSTGRTIVYVLDAGVGKHQDLNVVEWVNGANHAYDCGTRTGVVPALQACSPSTMPKLVACYTHSTALAGIIGAVSNSFGVVGIDPGANIVSVSWIDPTTSTTPGCLTNGSTVIQGARVLTALSWIAQDIATNNHSGKPSVINMSMNWDHPTQWTNASAIKAEMALIGSSTPGAFIVQSAGNEFADACNYAYYVGADCNHDTPSSTDGVMVVGAINNHGQAVVPLNGAYGFWKDMNVAGENGFGHDFGSNYGTAVEAWAPGDGVFTTVGPGGTQQGNTTYNTYGYGSGTSFAAPHVAGLAAFLIDTSSALTTPALVEQNVRSKFSALGSVDPVGLPIKLPTVNPLPGSTPHNTPYAEFLLSYRCIFPAFEAGVTTPPVGCLLVYGIDPPSYVTRNRDTMSLGSHTQVWLSFESRGSGTYTCDVQVGSPLGGFLQIGTAPPGYWTQNAPVGINQMARSSACPSASVSVGP